MPRASVSKSFFTFNAGKHSDGNPLSTPENTARVLENVDLEVNGRISRRLGLDYEASFQLNGDAFTETDLKEVQVNFYEWLTVGEDGNTNFFVVRVGETIFFYNQAGNPPSTDLIGQINISSQSVDTFESKKHDVQVSFGKGVLFVTGEFYDPFYIEYDAFADTFTIIPIDIQIRDFEGVVDEVGILGGRPSVLTPEHQYNIQNQGWVEPNISAVGFPANSDIQSLGFTVNEDAVRVFSLSHLNTFPGGTTQAPRGHYIFNAFAQDRLEASGIFGLPVGGTLKRPHSTAFFSSRVWYAAVNGNIYFSQILTELDKVGKCYQAQDPTSEEFNELLDTDGGVIVIPEIGIAHNIINVGNDLLVVCNNGIWSISGGEANFTANASTVKKISDVGVVSSQNIVVAEGTVFFWSDEGIFVLTADQITGELSATSITDNRINGDLNDIPVLSRQLAQGGYDRVNKKIYWSYHDGQANFSDNILSKYNAAIVYDTTLNAFYDYKIGEVDPGLDRPHMAGMIKGNARSQGSDTQRIQANGVDVQVNGDPVQNTIFFDSYADIPMKVLTFAPDTPGIWKVTFSEFCSRSFHDWFTLDSVGVNYESIIETNPETLGEGMLDKQATYLFSYYDHKRGGFNQLLATPRPDPKDGFRCTQEVVELLRRGIPLLRGTQEVIEVLRAGDPNMRSSQAVIEVLRK